MQDTRDMRSACLVSFDWIACRLMAAHRSRCFIWFLECWRFAGFRKNHACRTTL